MAKSTTKGAREEILELHPGAPQVSHQSEVRRNSPEPGVKSEECGLLAGKHMSQLLPQQSYITNHFGSSLIAIYLSSCLRVSRLVEVQST